MHSLMIAMAIFLMAIWLLLLPVRVLIYWRQTLDRQTRAHRDRLDMPSGEVE